MVYPILPFFLLDACTNGLCNPPLSIALFPLPDLPYYSLQPFFLILSYSSYIALFLVSAGPSVTDELFCGLECALPQRLLGMLGESYGL